MYFISVVSASGVSYKVNNWMSIKLSSNYMAARLYIHISDNYICAVKLCRYSAIYKAITLSWTNYDFK